MSWTVYKHTSPSGKAYIGITSRPVNERWQKGFGYSGQIFFNAILKYGWDNIKHEILFENLSHDEACSIERELIKQCRESPNGCYNVTDGGEGCCRPCSEQTKQKIREALMGKPGKRGPDNHFYGMTGELNPFYGQHHSEETRQLLSEQASQLYKGVNNPMYGKHHSEETKRKIAERATGRNHREITRIKMSLQRRGELHPMYGKHHSEETKRKISAHHTGISLPESQKRKISETLSQTRWVNKGGKNKRIRESELPEYLLDGWVQGRIYKPNK